MPSPQLSLLLPCRQLHAPLIGHTSEASTQNTRKKSLEERMHMRFKAWSSLQDKAIWCWIRRCVSFKTLRSFSLLPPVEVLKPAQQIALHWMLKSNIHPWSTAILLSFSLGIWLSDLKRSHEYEAQATCHAGHVSLSLGHSSLSVFAHEKNESLIDVQI